MPKINGLPRPQRLTQAAISARELEPLARNIQPGGWAIHDDKPISTILGSCVAVCLYDPQLKLAGMNHFLLPGRGQAVRNDPDLVLHGEQAMEALCNAMYQRGASSERLLAKAFGGANVLASITDAIGTQNADFARAWLRRAGITLLGEDLGGTWARKVVFDPDSGYAYCRRITVQQPEVLASIDTERNYAASLLNV